MEPSRHRCSHDHYKQGNGEKLHSGGHCSTNTVLIELAKQCMQDKITSEASEEYQPDSNLVCSLNINLLTFYS